MRFTARHEPGGHVSRCAGVHSLEGFPPRIEFEDLDGEACIQRAETIGKNGGLPFGKNQSQGSESGALCGLAGFFEPEQAVGEAAFERVLRFAFGDSEESDLRRAAVKNATGVDFGERVLEILRDADFFEGLVRELFGEDTAQLLAETFAREIAGAGGVFEANDFHALWPRAAEAFDGERVLGIVGDGNDAAGNVAVFRPQVKQRLFGVSTNFPGERRRGGDAAAVLADFDRTGDEDILKAGAQVLGQIHGDSLI